jgi:hypothetical protein
MNKIYFAVAMIFILFCPAYAQEGQLLFQGEDGVSVYDTGNVLIVKQ